MTKPILRAVSDRPPVIAFCVLAPLALCSLGFGQLQALKKPGRAASIDALVERLSDDKGWWSARSQLLERGKTNKHAVLAAVAAVARTGKGVEQKRARLVLDALIDRHVRDHKQRERLECLAAVQDAWADVQDGGGEKARHALQKAMKKLEKSLATEKPLTMPPLKVPQQPVARKRPMSRSDKKTSKKAGDTVQLGGKKYRKIKVGDKTVLVPADSLGDDDDYKAEFKDGGLHVYRQPNKKKNQDKKNGDKKNEDQGKEERKDPEEIR